VLTRKFFGLKSSKIQVFRLLYYPSSIGSTSIYPIKLTLLLVQRETRLEFLVIGLSEFLYSGTHFFYTILGSGEVRKEK
jgi:hypothetical protein